EVTVAATCTEDGVMTYTCACGDSYTEVIPATGHHYVNGVCIVCGAEEPGAGEHSHSYTAEVTVAATCTEDGVMTYTCACGDSYTEVIPATGHHYVNGVCTVCGAKKPGAGGSGWSGWDGSGALSTFLTNMMNRVFTRLTNLFTKFW
ncbi:MAG: hypothetical protein LUF84_05095, partial [Clostridiales bacterium]|nr:hypothetical protein [Clostridiales bacterium]